MANVLILSLVFPPDGVSTAHIIGELAEDLNVAGHRVVVITTIPHYNLPRDETRQQPGRRLWAGLVWADNSNGIDVFRVVMPGKTANLVFRAFSWIWFHALSTVLAMWLKARPDVLLVPSPPLTIGLSAVLISSRYRIPFIYNVQELYPDIAVHLGVIRNERLIWILHQLEMFIYNRASKITAITESIQKRIKDKGIPDAKVEVIPNFVDTQVFSPTEVHNDECMILAGFRDKFIVSYAGNIGPAQNLTALIEAARILRQDRTIHFVIMGGGTSLKTLRDQVGELKLDNITFIPYQPLSVVPAFYRASDLGVVALDASVGSDAVPSKVLRMMACGTACLAIAELHSDLANLVLSTGCGVVVPPTSPDEVAAAIRNLASDDGLIVEMGMRGRARIEFGFTRSDVGFRYNNLVNAIVKTGSESLNGRLGSTLPRNLG